MDMRQHGQGIEACMFGDGCLEKHNIYIYIYQSPQVNVYCSTHPVFFQAPLEPWHRHFDQ